MHTEETTNVLERFKVKVKYDPNAKNKSSLIYDNEYELGSDQARDDRFMMNVTLDLWLWGY